MGGSVVEQRQLEEGDHSVAHRASCLLCTRVPTCGCRVDHSWRPPEAERMRVMSAHTLAARVHLSNSCTMKAWGKARELRGQRNFRLLRSVDRGRLSREVVMVCFSHAPHCRHTILSPRATTSILICKPSRFDLNQVLVFASTHANSAVFLHTTSTTSWLAAIFRSASLSTHFITKHTSL